MILSSGERHGLLRVLFLCVCVLVWKGYNIQTTTVGSCGCHFKVCFQIFGRTIFQLRKDTLTVNGHLLYIVCLFYSNSFYHIFIQMVAFHSLLLISCCTSLLPLNFFHWGSITEQPFLIFRENLLKPHQRFSTRGVFVFGRRQNGRMAGEPKLNMTFSTFSFLSTLFRTHYQKYSNHLSDHQGSAIVAQTNSLLSPFSEFLKKMFIKPYVHTLPAYIRDCTDFINKIAAIIKNPCSDCWRKDNQKGKISLWPVSPLILLNHMR